MAVASPPASRATETGRHPLNGWAMELALRDPANGFCPVSGSDISAFEPSPSMGGGWGRSRQAVVHRDRRRDGASRPCPGNHASTPPRPLRRGKELHRSTPASSRAAEAAVLRPMAEADRAREHGEDRRLWPTPAPRSSQPVRTNAGFLVRSQEHPRFVGATWFLSASGLRGDSRPHPGQRAALAAESWKAKTSSCGHEDGAPRPNIFSDSA
jgi:hypothetical protein